MCTSFERREANRMYWMVKGMLIPECWSDKDIKGIYESYINRLWGNHENCVHEDGFEQAWNTRQADIISEELESVAILGYN